MAEEFARLNGGLLGWWRASLKSMPFPAVAWRFVSGLAQFARESLPSRRRQRYGDVDFDWDHRVDTTAATVPWRERLLGTLHSPYQPTEPALFHEILGRLQINFQEFIFVDLGSGKGRTLLMASDYPFKQILGVELLDSLHEIAVENIGKYRNASQRCFRLESTCCDAAQFVFPPEATVLYLFNPLPASGLAQVVKNIECSLQETPRPVFVLYHNPEHEELLLNCPALQRSAGTESYSIFASKH